MSNSKRVRIVRGPRPRKKLKRYNYSDALPELLRDFDNRCAYSMQHSEHAGPLTVDHFDPRRKNDYIQDYENLFPASQHCNRRKWNYWPKRDEAAAGCRFLNPCKEIDYGEQIFEDRFTHELIGTNPAARWHIRICGLNSPHLIAERVKRAIHLEWLKMGPILVRGDFEQAAEFAQGYRQLVETLIPEIPSLPVPALRTRMAE
jgi:HNH endonuclease